MHDEAPRAEDTDWPQILALYDAAASGSPPNPMVTLNRAVAVAMVRRARRPASTLLDALDVRRPDGRATTGSTPVRAHLLEMAGDLGGARASYRAAARRTTSLAGARLPADQGGPA